MLLCYTHDEWRSSLVRLEETQRLMAARFRATMAGHLAEPDQAEHLVHPAAADAVAGGQGGQMAAGGPARVPRPGLQ